MSPASKPVVDPLSDVLSLLRPRSYAFRGLDAAGRWAVDFPAAAGLRCYAIDAGGCWLVLDTAAAPLWLGAGDVVLLPHGEAFRLATALDAEPADAIPLLTSVPEGEVAVLNGGGETTGVGGYFAFAPTRAERLLRALPPVVHIASAEDEAGLHGFIARLMRELREPRPGGRLVAEHLAQTLLVQALRLHLADAAAGGVGWLYALADPRMSLAIAAIHAKPGRRWTLVALADIAGMSRSSFAARFRASVGEPPMEYLTRWRMLMASDRILNAAQPISTIAPALGYESESAFGAAFKREFGISPRRYGREARAA